MNFQPSTCQYIVVLESQLFCDAIQKVDKFGLFPEGALENLEEMNGQKEAEEEEKPQISGLIIEERKIEKGYGVDGENKVKRKTKVEIGLINQVHFFVLINLSEN